MSAAPAEDDEDEEHVLRVTDDADGDDEGDAHEGDDADALDEGKAAGNDGCRSPPMYTCIDEKHL